MRARAPIVALLSASFALAQIDDEPVTAKDGMALPNAGNWGASWEPTPKPTKPAVPGIPWLQTLIDEAPEGGVLQLPAGRYSGPVVMTKKLVVDGQGQAIVDNGGEASVFTLETSGATLRGLVFTGSGSSHNTDDTCLNVRGHRNVIEDNRFDDCLFGIDLKQSNDNVVRRNRVRSLPVDLGLRGDAIRLWYSMKNVVEDNEVIDSRDVVVWYSNGNVIRRNVGRRGRYSLHFMYAQHNVVEDNRYFDNSVGIYVMYTDGVEIRRNLISHSVGATGMGIGFKEASDSVVEGNTIVYCAVGIASDLSPYQPDSTISIKDNRISYNGVGLSFLGDKAGTTVEGNVFEGNIDPVSKSGGGGATNNLFRANYWDDYQGFDRDGDAVGDTAYELYAYSDRLWMEEPTARFFKNAPLMEALDFLERLAPFSTPDLLVRDEAPRFVKPTLPLDGKAGAL
ncbi:MAG: nitrous oxide reductase family maturation protein NosD [Myxococcaceae bacterium]|jgi:nitrous oxidase accessory protein|nr:nitrous oxide reductase family maturation protein NosD [Myxococcaceae bacterium]